MGKKKQMALAAVAVAIAVNGTNIDGIASEYGLSRAEVEALAVEVLRAEADACNDMQGMQ